MPTWLTADEIAQRLGRPVSTVRSWRDRYRDLVPERRDRRGRQLYPCERLAEIGVMQDQRLNRREIRAALAASHGWEQGEGPATPRPAATIEQVLVELREIRKSVDWLVERERARSD